ncbi:MAG: major facilitator superfamily domain-containing protein 6 [Sideroxydans sp.]
MPAHRTYYRAIAGFYFFYFAFVGMFAPYWSLYLQSLRFDAIDIATLMALQPVMRMTAPNLWGWLADYTGQRRAVVVMAAALSALFYVGVFFTQSFWGLFAVLLLMNFFWSASMPLVEATTFSYLGRNTAHYGRLRSWGSIGFIVSVVGLGYAFDHIAIAWLLWAGLACELGILFFARQIPETRASAHHSDQQPILRIVLQPHVLALLAASFLMAVAHAPYYTFFSIHLVGHAYSKTAVGLLWALGVVCEIVVFFLMPRLAQRFSPARLLQAGLAAAVLRFLLIGWCVDNLAIMLGVQMLHALTFGAFHVAAVALVHAFFRGRHQSRGQALYSSLSYGAGGMLGTLASGPVWHHWGASMLYSVSAAIALFGLLIVLWHNRALTESQ